MPPMIDSPVATVPVETQMILVGEFVDRRSARETVLLLESRIEELLQTEFPQFRVDVTNSLIGDVRVPEDQG